MAQVLIRDLDSDILKKLKQRAEENHRSLQGELHLILTQAAAAESASDSNARAPSKGASQRRATNAPANGVWQWLKRPAAGKLSKEDIDSYIRAERASWESS
jgi:plasmid stability protein